MKLRRLIFLLLTGLAFGGCAANVNVNYVPDPAHKSPLETIKHLTVSIAAEDQRDEAERNRVGDRKNGFGQPVAPVILMNQSPIVLVQEALRKEFSNNGIQLVDATSNVPHKAITANSQSTGSKTR